VKVEIFFPKGTLRPIDLHMALHLCSWGLLNANWSTVKVTNITGHVVENLLVTIYMDQEWKNSCTYELVVNQNDVSCWTDRPCRSTSRQVFVLSTTVWWENAARMHPVLVWCHQFGFVPDHLSSTYPGLPNGGEEWQGTLLYTTLGYQSLHWQMVVGQYL